MVVGVTVVEGVDWDLFWKFFTASSNAPFVLERIFGGRGNFHKKLHVRSLREPR